MRVADEEEYQRTIKFAETAVGHLKANSMPAYPRNYELWYTYVSGMNPSLNRAINDLLKVQGKISSNETEKMYDEYLSPQRFSDQMEQIGGEITAQLQDMLKTLDTARAENNSYGEKLSNASSHMAQHGTDVTKLKSVVEHLLHDTKKMEERNRELEKNLSVSHEKIEDLKTTMETIRHESLTDPLTSLSNRKLFDQAMLQAISDAESGADKMFSLMMTDIDHFKKFNDTYGHQTGDQVLRLVASVMRQNIKGQDIGARYGGEEFAVILPNTAIEHAMRVAENIRIAVMGKDLVKRSTNERLGRVTISIGVSSWRAGDTPQSMIERADTALYRAKRTGRNRVCQESDDVETGVAVA
ncbi:MAG: diguanylate cyclase [Pseudomonadota bacterium]